MACFLINQARLEAKDDRAFAVVVYKKFHAGFVNSQDFQGKDKDSSGYRIFDITLFYLARS